MYKNSKINEIGAYFSYNLALKQLNSSTSFLVSPVTSRAKQILISNTFCSFSWVEQLFKENMAANSERTFIMVKPDGVQRGLIGDIIKRFEQKGFKLVAMKFMQVMEFLKI